MFQSRSSKAHITGSGFEDPSLGSIKLIRGNNFAWKAPDRRPRPGPERDRSWSTRSRPDHHRSRAPENRLMAFYLVPMVLRFDALGCHFGLREPVTAAASGAEFPEGVDCFRLRLRCRFQLTTPSFRFTQVAQGATVCVKEIAFARRRFASDCLCAF